MARVLPWSILQVPPPRLQGHAGAQPQVGFPRRRASCHAEKLSPYPPHRSAPHNRFVCRLPAPKHGRGRAQAPSRGACTAGGCSGQPCGCCRFPAPAGASAGCQPAQAEAGAGVGAAGSSPADRCSCDGRCAAGAACRQKCSCSHPALPAAACSPETGGRAQHQARQQSDAAGCKSLSASGGSAGAAWRVRRPARRWAPCWRQEQLRPGSCRSTSQRRRGGPRRRLSWQHTAGRIAARRCGTHAATRQLLCRRSCPPAQSGGSSQRSRVRCGMQALAVLCKWRQHSCTTLPSASAAG